MKRRCVMKLFFAITIETFERVVFMIYVLLLTI